MICSIERSQPVNIAAASRSYTYKNYKHTHIGATASIILMENVYFGTAKLTLDPDEITFACRELLPLAKHAHFSASHATPFISIIRCSQLEK